MRAFSGRCLVARAALGLVVAQLSACAPAAPAPTPPPPPTQVKAQPAGGSSELTALIEGARKETLIKAQWSSSSFGGQQAFEDYVGSMNKKWGLNVKPQFTPGPDQQAMLAKIAQEAAAGQSASSDVYLGNAPAALDAQKNRVLRPVNWNALLDSPLPKDPDFDPIAPDNSAVAFASTLVGVTFNAELVKGADVPRKLEDLMHPKWKGKIASTPYAAGFREFAAANILGREYVIDFVKRYTTQVGGLIRCGEADRITSGEFVMLGMDCGGEDVIIGKQRGLPLDQVVLDDATVVHTRYAGVPTNSGAPNAATLLIVYLLSPEGQAALWKWSAIDLHVFPTSHTRPRVEQIKAAGGRYGVNSPQWLGTFPDFSAQQKEISDILQQAGR